MAAKPADPGQSFELHLRRLMDDYELDRRQLARLAGVTPGAVTGWFAIGAERRLPSSAALMRLGRSTGWSLNYLLLGEGSKRREVRAPTEDEPQRPGSAWQKVRAEVLAALARDPKLRRLRESTRSRPRGMWLPGGVAWLPRSGVSPEVSAEVAVYRLLRPAALTALAKAEYVKVFEARQRWEDLEELTMRRAVDRSARLRRKQAPVSNRST